MLCCASSGRKVKKSSERSSKAASEEEATTQPLLRAKAKVREKARAKASRRGKVQAKVKDPNQKRHPQVIVRTASVGMYGATTVIAPKASTTPIRPHQSKARGKERKDDRGHNPSTGNEKRKARVKRT